MTEVARLRMPVMIAGMDKLVAYLTRAYGKGMTFHQEGNWMIFEVPMGADRR